MRSPSSPSTTPPCWDPHLHRSRPTCRGPGRPSSLAAVFTTALRCATLLLVPPFISAMSPTIFTRQNATQAFDAATAKSHAPCPVIYLSKTEPMTDPATNQPLALGMFRAIFTDATDLVPFGRVSHPLYHMDTKEFLVFPRSMTEAKMGKRKVSFLFPTLDRMDQVIYSLYEEAREAFPEHVYIDDGRPSRHKAFADYSISLLLSHDNTDLPSQTLLDAVAYGVVPGLIWFVDDDGNHLIKHFLDYCYYFKYAVAKFRFPSFTPQSAMKFLTETMHPDAIYVMQSSLKLVQDFFYMRYRLPFWVNLHRYAESVCTEQEQHQLTPFAFIGILSGKANFNRRQAMRDTWLKVLENDIPRGLGPLPDRAPQRDANPIRVTYKFFVNRVGADPADTEDPDWLLRGEAELFRDIVFLDAIPEYPIGNQGMNMFHWVANHTDAPFILKIDDDIYLRPVQFFQQLASYQRSMLYLGAFDYSGEVVRDPESAHFLADANFESDVFPPYARGAGVVISLDLVRKFVAEDRRKKLYRLKVEDASYGYYLHQLVTRNLTSVTINDMMEENFAMDPKCCTELTHPNNCWAPLRNTSWLVHHMKPNQLVCMFNQDIESRLYQKVQLSPPGPAPALGAAPTGHVLPGFGSGGVLTHNNAQRRVREEQLIMWLTNFGGEVKQTLDLHEVHVGDGQMADLCGCVHTPPPHPDQPHDSPTTAFREVAGKGPELQHRPTFGWGLDRDSTAAIKTRTEL